VPEIQEHLVPGLSCHQIVTNLHHLALRAAALEFELACSSVVLDANVRQLSGYVRFLAQHGIRRWIVARLYPWGPFYAQEKRIAAVDDEEKAHLVSAAIQLAADLGIRVESNFGHGIPALAGPPLQSRFRSLDEQRFVVDLARPGFCPSLASTAVFTADGTLRPCCRHPIDLGSIAEAGFLDLWNGPAMQTLRQEFFERSLRPACVACRAYEASGAEQPLMSQSTEITREAKLALS
jgi:hypothetical protein